MLLSFSSANEFARPQLSWCSRIRMDTQGEERVLVVVVCFRLCSDSSSESDRLPSMAGGHSNIFLSFFQKHFVHRGLPQDSVVTLYQ